MTAPTLDAQLEPWCAAGASGALRLLGPPGGTVYLVDGRVVYAECPRVCGINRLLTVGGQVPADALRPSVTAAGLTAAATAQGQITPLELEVLFRATLHSAFYVLAAAEVSVRFQVGVRHPLAGLAAVDLAHLRAETGRRRRVMHETWPDARVDSAPVTPIRRISGQRVVLTTLQWEIVINAGRRRTPVDLSRRLGRDTYATLLAVRQLVAAGLIAPPPPEAAQVTSAAARSAPQTPAPPRPAARRNRATPAGRPPEHSLQLPRREPSAAPPDTTEPGDEPPWTDIELVRIRDALQALP